MLDEAAIAALAERYGPMVLRRCRRLLVDEEDARDACQDVFVRVVAGRRRIDGRALSSLLYRIATNVCLNRLRDGRRRPEHAPDGVLDRIASAEEPSAMSDARLLLDRLFARHPVSSRTIAVLHYVDGLTLEETAAVAGLSVSGVRRRLRLLRHVLRELQR
ncbi:MAG: sigma-70 family RNA polymerase sigma factor [Vicinamibacterales bacterium]